VTAPTINSVYDISDKAKIELKAWLEPWFLNRAVAAAAGLEYVSTTFAVSETAGETPDRYPLEGGEAGIRYALGGDWFTASSGGFSLAVGTYLIFYAGGFGDLYQLGGTPLIELTDGVATFATGGASSPVATPWILLLSNMATAGAISPFCYLATTPPGPTFLSITVIRLSTRAGGEVA
jgi:hypothetical protein